MVRGEVKCKHGGIFIVVILREMRVRIEKSCGCAVIESEKGAYRQKS